MDKIFSFKYTKLLASIVCLIAMILSIVPSWAAGRLKLYSDDPEADMESAAAALNWDIAESDVTKNRGDKVDNANIVEWNDQFGGPHMRYGGSEYERYMEFDDSTYEWLMEDPANGGLNFDNMISDLLNEGGAGGVSGNYGMAMVNMALSQVGNGGGEYQGWVHSDGPWSVSFLCWCAAQIGCGHAFGTTSSAAAMASTFLDQEFEYFNIEHTSIFASESYKSKHSNEGGDTSTLGVPDISLGDIVIFNNRRAGIIVNTGTDYVDIVEGDINGQVVNRRFTQDDVTQMGSSGVWGIVYHVIYPDSSGDWKQVYYWCKKLHNMPDAGIAALCGNILHESRFLPYLTAMDTNYAYSGGLFMWNADRLTRMQEEITAHGLRWESYQGQLWYVEYEINTCRGGIEGEDERKRGHDNRTAWQWVMEIADDASSAHDAAKQWAIKFEVCVGAGEGEGDARGTDAEHYYEEIQKLNEELDAAGTSGTNRDPVPSK